MKILIIKPSSFGDIVQAAPCATILKKAYPGCKISWVVFKPWADILGIFPDIDEVLTWDRKKGIGGFLKILKNVRKEKYDITIDLQGLFRSALLARFSKAVKKIGVPGMKENSGVFIKEVFPENATMNATLRNLEPVRFLTGKTYAPEVNVKIDEETQKKAENILKENRISGKFIALLPFARGKGKDWSVDNYHVLIKLLSDKYKEFQIAVLGSQNGSGKIKSDSAADLCGKTDLKALAGVLAKASVAAGADTGPMHLAAVLNVPSVFIFGDSDIVETSPHIGNFSLLINEDNRKEIDKISPEKVFTEIQKWIK